MKTSIWWIRRDLRLSDNQALYAAMQAGEQVIPLFIIDPKLAETNRQPEKRLNFLWGGLQALDDGLRKIGSQLIVRRGSPGDELRKLINETSASTVFAEKDITPYAIARDRLVSKHVSLKLTPGLTVLESDDVLKADGTPYTVFTPFSKTWKTIYPTQKEPILSIPGKINTPDNLASFGIPEHTTNPLFPAGEQEAHQRLIAFTKGDQAPIFHYADLRNRPDLAGTSALSPYMRFGMISARQAVLTANLAMQVAVNENARKGAQTWLNELIWREFFISILTHFPGVKKQSFRPDLRRIPWRNDPAEFEAWKHGQTGYPIVDAAMRQLLQTGWMHNRSRMIVASFLVKDLLIDWRWGERWFMQNLVDGDIAANNGGWQWSAGTGTDAAPYFRIFNPILQGKKFDPNGDYVRSWIPELSEVATQYIHTPWNLPDSQLINKYPKPIIDHSFARERTLEAYRIAKESVK